MSMQMPEFISNFEIYDSKSSRLLGVVDVELPEVTLKSETVAGAGIAGDVDAPNAGHVEAMEVTINWRTITPDAVNFLKSGSQMVTLRGSQQLMDPGAGTLKHQGVRAILTVRGKGFGTGTAAVGAATGTSNTLAVTYYKLVIDDKDALEIDQYNFVYKVGGVDQLAQMRKNLGR
jgi:P2 family phage contractile tail tube protein